jgi:hypothetical protein
MKKPAQELIIPPATASTAEPGIVEWLFAPMPGRFFLPATGLWILGLDWLLFSKEFASLGLATPATAIIGFLAGSIGAYRFQRRYAQDNGRRAWVKALLAGLAVGVPFPLTGTLVGGWILANSGLIGLKDRLLRR